MTNSDGYNINTFLIIVNIVNQLTTISDMLQRESGNQVVKQIWECVSSKVKSEVSRIAWKSSVDSTHEYSLERGNWSVLEFLSDL